jgi:hypothetical protein
MWKYQNAEIKTIDEFPNDSFGFVYKIYNTINDKIYIGKKFLYHSLKRKINGKSKKIKKESDWKTYCGSNKDLKNDVKNGHIIEKEILHICKTCKQLTYYEMKYLFMNSVLENQKYYNDNIGGKFFRKDT